jgi:ribosomal protein S18 acetylase RimI-like enzyme
MVDIIQYNAKYEKELCKLHSIAHNNSDIYYDNKLSIEEYIPNIDKIKIRLLKIGDKLRGYILFNNSYMTTYKDRVDIHEIYIEKKFNTYMNYYNLIESTNKGFLFKRCKYAQLYFNNNKKSFDIISKLNLTIDKKMVEMKISLTGNRRIDNNNSISFTLLKKGIDEDKRAVVQNSIFKNTVGHVDCSTDDIIYEEEQDYYIEDGCIFINYNNQIAGYSQIILEKYPFARLCIVNFGILEEFRSIGLSSLLLNHTLNTVRQKGFNEAYLTVNASNKKAYNLYKKNGFKNVCINSSYLYKYKCMSYAVGVKKYLK